MLSTEYAIRRQIILDGREWLEEEGLKIPELNCNEDIDNFWEHIEEEIKYGEGCLYDEMNEFRESGEMSGLPSDSYSRHYENHEVARVLDDGTCVGWTYWYGGGKHGAPEDINWVEDAYYCTYEEVMKPVRTYERVL